MSTIIEKGPNFFTFLDSYKPDPNFNQGFQLDIVGFLAILGEGSVETIAQVACLSVLIYVPRLIPAPQTFIRTQRPEGLETTSKASVIGIHSGNSGTDIHHVAHALHRGDRLPANTVKCVRVVENKDRDWPSIRRFGPLAGLVLIGFLMSVGLTVLSIQQHDGMALLATLSLSFLSTTTGIANKWKHVPVQPRPDPNSPPADVVIKYPQGAFIIVKCDETTARYLYFNPSERCEYLIGSTTFYRLLSLVSTLLLMAGVICLANASIIPQTAFAGCYMIINIFYWIGAALPPSSHWDLTRLVEEEIEIKGGAAPRSAVVLGEDRTYTAALWKAIAITQSKNWVREAGWAPKTPAWDDWLHEAEDAANSEDIGKRIERKLIETGGGRWWEVPQRGWMFWNKRNSNPRRLSLAGPGGHHHHGAKERDVEVWTIRDWDYKGRLGTLLKTHTSTNLSKMEDGRFRNGRITSIKETPAD